MDNKYRSTMMGLPLSPAPPSGKLSSWFLLCIILPSVAMQVSSFQSSHSRIFSSSCGARRRYNCPDDASRSRSAHSFSFSMSTNNDWMDLSGDGGVQKQIISDGDGDVVYSSGTPVTIQYTGTTATLDWSAEQVVTCWLSEQQGVEDLADGFVTQQVDLATLINPEIFQEHFIASTLGVVQKIKCKKLVMAAKRLATTLQEFPPGIAFDENGSFEFTLGTAKVIKGMDLGVLSMLPGETCLLKIRCDYAYGGEGYRKKNGDVMVPPFATLQFQLTLQ